MIRRLVRQILFVVGVFIVALHFEHYKETVLIVYLVLHIMAFRYVCKCYRFTRQPLNKRIFRERFELYCWLHEYRMQRGLKEHVPNRAGYPTRNRA